MIAKDFREIRTTADILGGFQESEALNGAYWLSHMASILERISAFCQDRRLNESEINRTKELIAAMIFKPAD